MNLENKDVDGILQYADPVIAAILNKAISGKDITSREALVLFDAKGIDFQLVGKVADYLRRKKVGDIVTYVAPYVYASFALLVISSIGSV